MRIFENLNVDFLGKRKIAYMLSTAIFLAGIISIIARGLELGVDFKGGTEIVLQFENPVDVGSIRTDIGNIGLGEVEVKTFGGESGIMIRIEDQVIPPSIYPKVVESIENKIEIDFPGLERTVIDSSANSVTYEFTESATTDAVIDALFEAGFQAGRISEEPDNVQLIVRVGISDWIKENLNQKLTDNPFIVLKEDIVGPKIGEELKRDAVLAIFFSLIAILVYLGFRFKFIFAFAAVTALFHDVLITLGIFSLLYGLIPGLNLEITITVVAGFLTLIGYSINDTVVNFDRVRENLKIHKTRPIYQIVNDSINQTMSRTILTSGTTLLAVGVLVLFGGEVLKSFAFALIIGVFIGTYSSIFVASALVYEYAEKYKKKLEF